MSPPLPRRCPLCSERLTWETRRGRVAGEVRDLYVAIGEAGAPHPPECPSNPFRRGLARPVAVELAGANHELLGLAGA